MRWLEDMAPRLGSMEGPEQKSKSQTNPGTVAITSTFEEDPSTSHVPRNHENGITPVPPMLQWMLDLVRPKGSSPANSTGTSGLFNKQETMAYNICRRSRSQAPTRHGAGERGKGEREDGHCRYAPQRGTKCARKLPFSSANHRSLTQVTHISPSSFT